MRHYFIIDGYDKENKCHLCIDSDGKLERIDIMSNGELKDIKPEELVGKKISVSYCYPYISIAMGVIVEN